MRQISKSVDQMPFKVLGDRGQSRCWLKVAQTWSAEARKKRGEGCVGSVGWVPGGERHRGPGRKLFNVHGFFPSKNAHPLAM